MFASTTLTRGRLSHPVGRPTAFAVGRLGSLAAILALGAGSPALGATALNPSAFASSGALDLTSGSYTIDTNGGPGGAPELLDSSNTVIATGSLYNQGGSVDPTVGVLAFSNVTIGYGVTVKVTGANPLALLSTGSQSISGQIIATGGAGQTPNGGAGSAGAGGPGGFAGGVGAPGGSNVVGAAGAGPGGGLATFGGYYGFGAGGSYGGSAAGGLFSNPIYSGPTYGDLNTALLGGSGGSGGGGAFGDSGPGGGGGGGAIELAALGSIAIANQSFQSGGLIDANGGGGPYGPDTNAGGG